MKSAKRKLSKITDRFSTPAARFYAFVAFFVILLFTGGGSRDDIQSLLVLRPLAILFCAYALTVKAPAQWKGRMFPLFIAGALLALMVLQLIPLPPSVWTALPERQIFADIADIAGIEQPWRPLTLSPSKTLNSLFALAVPIAAMMLYLNLERANQKTAVTVIIGLAIVSSLWAILQLAGPPRGPLYLYNITNNGSPVGLFSNRNHQSIFLAATIAMLGWYAATITPTARFAALRYYGSIAAIFLFVPLIFITGSRAGLILMVPAVIAATLMISFGRSSAGSIPSKTRVGSKAGNLPSSRKLVALGSLAAIILVAVLSIYFSRSLAFDRLFSDGEPGELRDQLVPILMKMMTDYFPWGSGMGTFEHVYKIHELQELLRPSYLNQAHNDWLQFPIEGGLPVMLIGTAAIVWFLTKLVRLAALWNRSHFSRYTALMSAFVMLCFLAASVGDYPLRVPSLVAVFGIMACVFNDSIRHAEKGK